MNWQLGFNTATVSFFGTIALAFFSAWGLVQQRRTIVKRNSGKSIFTASMVGAASYCLIILIYGITRDNWAMIVNGAVIGVSQILVLVELFKRVRLSSPEKLLCLGFVAVAASQAVDHSHVALIYLVMSWIGISSVFGQAAKIWWLNDVGSVDIKLRTVALVSSLFWTIYAFSTSEPTLKIFMPYSLAVQALTMAACLIYRNPKPADSANKPAH